MNTASGCRHGSDNSATAAAARLVSEPQPLPCGSIEVPFFGQPALGSGLLGATKLLLLARRSNHFGKFTGGGHGKSTSAERVHTTLLLVGADDHSSIQVQFGKSAALSYSNAGAGNSSNNHPAQLPPPSQPCHHLGGSYSHPRLVSLGDSWSSLCRPQACSRQHDPKVLPLQARNRESGGSYMGTRDHCNAERDGILVH